MTALERASLDVYAVSEERMYQDCAVRAVYNSIHARAEPVERTACMMIAGYTPTQIGHALGCTRQTVHRYARTLRSTMASLLDYCT